MFSTFGSLFQNEQLMRLSELRLPFRLLGDCNHAYYARKFSRLQMALSASQYECFKLRRSVSPLSTAKSEAVENYYMLETCDGRFLSVTELEKHKSMDEFTPIEFTVCDTSHTSPMTSCLFSLLPQPDGRFVIQSLSELCGKFINVYALTKHYYNDDVNCCTKKTIELKFGSTDNLCCATKFVLAPEPEKQIEWCAEFGGSVGLQQLNRLQTLRLPFYLLAEQKKYRFYVHAQKTHSVEQGDPWYANIEFRAEANTFILHGGCGDGTNCLLYASCGRYLCVVEHPDFGPVIGTSPLILDTNDATPLPKFLFNFVPCPIKHTFSIRSHSNQMYLRCDEQKILDYNIKEDAFPVDGTEETASEFVLSSISMSYTKDGVMLEQDVFVRTVNC